MKYLFIILIPCCLFGQTLEIGSISVNVQSTFTIVDGGDTLEIPVVVKLFNLNNEKDVVQTFYNRLYLEWTKRAGGDLTDKEIDIIKVAAMSKASSMKDEFVVEYNKQILKPILESVPLSKEVIEEIDNIIEDKR